MKSVFTAGLCLLLFLIACTNNDQRASGRETDVETARNFIRASLDNDFDAARSFLLDDSSNREYLDIAARNRGGLSREENRSYKEASIRIHDTKPLNDSTSIITYSNSYKNKKDALKVMRLNGEWRVDLKYSFNQNDSLP